MEGVSGVPAYGSDQGSSGSLTTSGHDGVKKHHGDPRENGTSNGTLTNNHSHSSSSGHHHSSSKDKSHSSSKHHHSSSSSSKHHSSSSGDKKHKSSSSSSSGDKKHSSSSSSKHHSSSSSSGEHKKHSSSSSSSEHKKHSSSSGEHKHSSSSGEHKKHSSSSSGEKKHHSSSSGDKNDKKHHHSSSSKHSSSSSSGDKKHSSSSSSSKHREHSSSKHKDGSSDINSRQEEKYRAEREAAKNGMEEAPPLVASVKSETIMVKTEPVTPVKEPKYVPSQEDSEDDMPLINRKQPKLETSPMKRDLSDEDDEPLAVRAKKVKAEPKAEKKVKKRKMKEEEEDFEDEDVPKKKKPKAKAPTPTSSASPTKRGKKKEETEEKWRWWEEERKDDGTKWTFLEHKGPMFAPPYERIPKNVHFYYDGQKMALSQDTEEVMTFYARMLDHDYTTMDTFNKNFFKDFRSVMTPEERETIKDLKKCNFRDVCDYFKMKTEERKAMSKEEKQKIKEENARIQEEYGFCTMDQHKEKIGNFRIEPPGLFRGRGSHPKMGMLKRRVLPKDVIINCSKNAKIPDPPDGTRWKEVRHDNTVTWLASWTENVQGGTKYVMLNPASRLKGEKDWMKYETARKLHQCVDKIRATYREDWKSKEMRIRQRAVALYFIDKLALRAGNEKDEETADTVGCCSLRVEHLTLHEQLDNKEFVVEFDFLGKDSIRYYNKVAVEKRVFKNLQLFMENKHGSDDLFDRLNTSIMNKHLQSLMDGLTAKVFRTYNASRTLQEQLAKLTIADDNIPGKMLSYNRANRAVAILCNHQRAVPKNFSKQMENIQTKIDAKKDAIHTAKKDLKAAKSDYKNTKTDKARTLVERRKKAVERLEEQLGKLEVQMTDKDENKDIALGTSKLNYLDPRISVAWCKKFDVPIEKIYNKTQRDKFAWAIDMTDEDYVF